METESENPLIFLLVHILEDFISITCTWSLMLLHLEDMKILNSQYFFPFRLREDIFIIIKKKKRTKSKDFFLLSYLLGEGWFLLSKYASLSRAVVSVLVGSSTIESLNLKLKISLDTLNVYIVIRTRYY